MSEPSTTREIEAECAALRLQVLAVLAGVPDPEMPISIVDLGMVERVVVGGPGDGTGGFEVLIELLPTMIGCPALPMIQSEVEEKVSALAGVDVLQVSFVNDPPWHVDRISEAGRADLREFGVTVPLCGCSAVSGDGKGVPVELQISAWEVTCPYCESGDTRLESAFGPTRCRMIYFCKACSNTFEHMKKLSSR